MTWALDILQLINISLSDIEIVTELSPSNITHPLIQTISDGKADLLAVSAGMTHSRYSLVDFSGATGFSETVIFSKKQRMEIGGNFLAMTFDLPTYVLAMLSVMLVSLTFWLSQNRLQPQPSLGPCTLYTVGNSLAGGLPTIMVDRISGRQKCILGIYGLMILVLYKSFSGTITASLLTQKKPKQINSLWDVANSHSLKIITVSGSFWHEDLMSHPAAAQMLDRIEMRPLLNLNPMDTETVLNDLYKGTHVLIGYEGYLSLFLGLSKEYFEEQFHHSPPFVTRPTGLVLSRRNQVQSNNISKGISWPLAYGLYSRDNTREFIQKHGADCQSRELHNCPRPSSAEKTSNLAKKRHLNASKDNKRETKLTLKHFQFIFYVLIVGLCLSALTFIVEIVAYYFAKSIPVFT